MSEELFFTVVFIATGFAILPFLLILFFSIIKRKLEKILVLISIVEFLTASSNLFIHYARIGFYQEQFFLYYFIEIIIWLYILNKYYINWRLTTLIVLSLITFLFIFTPEWSFTSFELASKVLQLLLGLFMFHAHFKDVSVSQLRNNLILTSIGILVYSFLNINLFLFKNVLNELNLNDFSLTWLIHQIAAVIYFTLLSINIWKNQRI